jgi:hypothetical protein
MARTDNLSSASVPASYDLQGHLAISQSANKSPTLPSLRNTKTCHTVVQLYAASQPVKMGSVTTDPSTRPPLPSRRPLHTDPGTQSYENELAPSRWSTVSVAAADQGRRSSVDDSTLSNAVNLDPPEQGYSSDEEDLTGRFTQAAKSRWKSAVQFSKDTWASTKNTFGQYNGTLCTACREIPFHEALPVSSEDVKTSSTGTTLRGEAVVFYRSLSKILNNRDICKLCHLLTQSVCQEEYDLLKPEHIRNYLPEGFGQNRSMADWVGSNNYWKREWIGGAGLWPFGYALDRSEAANSTLHNAKKLFIEAEDRDTKMNSVSDMYNSSADDARRALDATHRGLGMLYATNLRNKKLEHLFARMQVVSGQLALLQNKKRKRLPCIFMFRMYRRDEKKAGALSVRVYGHGRAPLAPLKEICHFSLRFESAHKPRCFESQLWYGNKLGQYIDTSFFMHCIEECRKRHSDRGGCRSSLDSTLPLAADFSPGAEFRLINVDTMSVMVVPFRDVTVSGSPYQYAALSYRWGKLKLLDGWECIKDPKSPDKIWFEKTGRGGKKEIRYDRPDATKLTAGNAAMLYRPNSLKQRVCTVPKTISDAIDVTRDVGVKYLWVDQLCTMQSGNDADKIGNIERMDSIYDHALFTIVAADGVDANAGLKGVGSARGAFKQVIEEGIIPGVHMFLPVNIKMDLQLWEERAWCFQEKVLSKRLLVFTGGFAVWYCRSAIWREDVNALDGDMSAVKFPWLHLTASTPSEEVLEHSGLRLRTDDSVRLMRRPAMRDYVAAVEDLSKRAIGYSWDILNAFRGISRAMESAKHLDSPFWQGMPIHFLDVALLWQTREPARRRKHDYDTRGRLLHFAPPSWSPFGWEADKTIEGGGAEGAPVEYPKPYDVWSGEKGITLRYNPDGTGEERVRPARDTLWMLDTTTESLRPVGLFGMQVMIGAEPPDWESCTAEKRAWALSRLPPAGPLSTQNLIVVAEAAILKLGQQTWRTTRTINMDGTEQSTITFEESNATASADHFDSKSSVPDETIDTCREYWLGTREHPNMGIGRIDLTTFIASQKDVKAVVLSEAQYLGNEDIPDVLGYPLYNVMLVRKVREDSVSGHVFAERVGLGKVYKFMWRTANPKRQVIILE